MDKLTAARYFLKVADTGSFSKTAKFYNLPVSTVSRRIKDLEQNLGAKLLRRTTRFLSLTEIGEIYYKQVENAVDAFDLAEEAVNQASGRPSGTIRISALPSYSEMHLYPLIQQFRNAYPDIVVDLNTTDQVQDLVRDKFDFAIRPTSFPPEHLIAKVIDRHKMLLVASPGYLKKFGEVRDYKDLTTHRALCYRSANGVMPWYAFKNNDVHVIDKKPYFLCNDTNELLRIAADGEGIALLPEWTAKRALEDGLIEQVNFGWDVSFVSDLDHRLYLLYEQKASELTRNKLFLEFFLRHIRTD
ncbi:MAG: LysR family transcriptional regulator [Pseudomonadota bacterium]